MLSLLLDVLLWLGELLQFVVDVLPQPVLLQVRIYSENQCRSAVLKQNEGIRLWVAHYASAKPFLSNSSVSIIENLIELDMLDVARHIHVEFAVRIV